MDMHSIEFGVEIETYVNAMAMEDADIYQTDYHSHVAQSALGGWKAERDGSLSSARRGETAVEFVSPRLKGIAGLDDITRMVTRIRSLRGRVDQTCGLHVSVNWPRTATAEQFKTFVASCTRFERGLFAATGSRRRFGNSFCTSVASRYRSLETAPDAIRAARLVAHKYTSVNLASLATGRIEFRLFAGTLNALKIRAYVMLCVGLVQKALKGTRAVKWEAQDAAHVGACLRRAGEGAMSLTLLLRYLGWAAEASSTVVRYGALVGYPVADGPYVKAVMQPYTDELRRLARKFDGPVVRPVSPVTLATQAMQQAWGLSFASRIERGRV
jgi:hypothetical protein